MATISTTTMSKRLLASLLAQNQTLTVLWLGGESHIAFLRTIIGLQALVQDTMLFNKHLLLWIIVANWSRT